MANTKFTPDLLQQMDEHQLAGGTEQCMLYARHRGDGRLAGFTDVFWPPDSPTSLKQDLTGVLPEYRGMGLGKLLKAIMLQRILQERAQVRYIRTIQQMIPATEPAQLLSWDVPGESVLLQEGDVIVSHSIGETAE